MFSIGEEMGGQIRRGSRGEEEEISMHDVKVFTY